MMVEDLPVPQSMFKHDFIAGLWPLLGHDPQSCLRVIQILGGRFAGELASTDIIIEQSRVDVTTDSFWSFLYH